MLVCRIEMWPGGDESKQREIGRVLIANIGGTPAACDYKVVLPKSAEYSRRPGTVWKQGVVKRFPRLRLGPHDLLLRALIACVGDRNANPLRELGDGELGSPPDVEATA